MSRWLGEGISKLSGQLTDFTREVLSETTEEIEDPNTELQVTKKKVTDLERQLQLAINEVDTLRLQNSELEERAASAELQLESLSGNYRRSLETKESEIRELQNQVHSEDTPGLPHSPPSPGANDFEIIQLNNQIKHLKAEVQHWKNVVKTQYQQPGTEDTGKFKKSAESLEMELEGLRQELMDTIEKHHTELGSLQEHHNDQLAQLRSQVGRTEEESWAWGEESGSWIQQASSSSEGDLIEKLEDLKEKHTKVQMETRTLIQEKQSLADKVSTERESNSELQKTVDTLKSWDDEETEKLRRDEEEGRAKIAELHKQVETLEQQLDAMDGQQQATVTQLMETKAELWRTLERKTEEDSAEKHATLEQLRAENSELTAAYNDLNEEFEKSKAASGNIQTSNEDLNLRLESLKADLIEYEEKYEKCKEENVRALKQLESLSAEFDRLKEVLNKAKAESAGELESEVSRLQEELNASSTKRDHLAGKMEEFQGIVVRFEEEVNQFREMNSQLMTENTDLKKMVESLLGCRETLGDTEKEIKTLRETVEECQRSSSRKEEQMKEQLERLMDENSRLRTESDEELGRLRQAAEQQEVELGGILEEKQNLTAQLESAMSAFSNQSEMEAWLSRYRELVGDEAAAAVENNASTQDLALIRSFLSDSSGGKGEREETDSGDSNGWDRLQQEEEEKGEGRRGEKAGGILTPAQLETQLKEALDALTEKTEECETAHKHLIQKDQELQEREELIQQVFTELKGLEMQVNELREREESLKANVQKLTMETARKETDIQNLRRDLEAAAEKEQEMEHKLAQAVGEKEEVEKKMRELEREAGEKESEVDPLLQQLRKDKADFQLKVEEGEAERKELEALLERGRMEAEIRRKELETRELEMVELKEEVEGAKKEARLHMEDAEKQKTDTELHKEKEQLIVLVNQKHEESLRFHQEAQRAAQSQAEQETQMRILEKQVETACGQVKELQSQLEESRRGSQEIKAQLGTLLTARETLETEKQALLLQLHKVTESAASKEPEVLRLKAELGAASSRKEEALRELEVERSGKESRGREMKTLEESKLRTEREVQRLMDHLLQVEENYTREAVASEERETQLRKQLRAAEEEAISHSQVAKGTSAQLMDDIEDLKVQLEAMAQQRDAALLELSENQEQLEKSHKSLSSLQGVLQHFQAERDSLVMEEIDRYKMAADDKEREKEKVLEELRGMERRLKEKESECKATAPVHEDLSRKTAELETLRKQLEMKDTELADFRARASRTEKIQSEKVDKELLKNLFLGYFSAPGNKKSEVAHLLGSVLSFSQEDFAKLEDGSGGGGWLAFLRRNGAGGQGSSGAPEQSIAAQFIQFLEAESAPDGRGRQGGVPMSLPPDSQSGHSRSSSRSSTPAGGLLRQQITGTPGNSLLSSASMELPSFSGDNPVLRPPSSTSDFLKEVLQNP